MTRLALVLSLLLSGLALAQQTLNTLALTVGGVGEEVATAGDCERSSRVAWTTAVTVGNVASSELKFWATTGECLDDPAAVDVSFSEEAVPIVQFEPQGSGTFDVRIADLPSFSQADGGAACGTLGLEVTNKICASFKYKNSVGTEATQRVTNGATITYDSKAPAVPSISGVTGLDKALNVNFSAPSDAIYVFLETRREGEADFTQKAQVSGALPSARLDGLENDVTYEVRAIAEDDVGNRSEPSAPATGTPVMSTGFGEAFVGSGGTGLGGCTAAGGGVLAVLGLLTAAGFVTRRRRS